MDNRKKTLILGASDNPSRYSYMALQLLNRAGHPVVAIGRTPSLVNGISIETEMLPIKDVDTVTLYLSPQHQRSYYDYILSLHPRRVIFNPGTENEELVEILESNAIPCEESCTLVLLQTGQY
jgi:predicted CoA-binding protein